MAPTVSVMIVEDVPEMLELLRVLVDGTQGFQTSSAVSSAVRARLELDRRRPSLVLLDEVLPNESSHDLLKELRGEGIPVILLTGMEVPSHSIPTDAAGRILKPTAEANLGDFERWKQEFETLWRKARAQLSQ